MKPIIVSLLLASSVPASAVQGPAHSPLTGPSAGGEERAVLATVDRFFAAVRAKDRAAILALVVPDGLATSLRLDGGPRLRSWHWTTYVENALGARETWTERLIEPQIRVDRDLAMVWARYELMTDDTFSHCGVDHFDLVRQDGQWRVYNLTWTNQTQGCPGR